jgi:rhodanese-related sulfurtransferase
MAPFALTELIGKFGAYAVYLLIGMGFGVALEMSGFGVSTKLTGQFYLRDQTVFKVMFSGVVVAMVLTFGASALGILDFNRVWVPPTYLWPIIVGGFLIGVGFLIGGFCPGTSIVGAASGKIDAFFYIAGILTGVIIFGESFGLVEQFYSAGDLGRLIIPDWLGVPTSVVVFVVTIVAIFLILGAEQLERIANGVSRAEFRSPRWRFAGAGALAVAALGVLLLGEPSDGERWQRVAADQEPLLSERKVQIHPAELRSVYYNTLVNLVMLDVRSESDYNIYHIKDATRVDPADLVARVPELLALPEQTVFVLMSNDEEQATAVWKQLVSRELRNVYILEGGVNNWLAVYGEGIEPSGSGAPGDETLRYRFTAALGAATPTATPSQHDDGIEFAPKVQLVKKAPTGGGGCG